MPLELLDDDVLYLTLRNLKELRDKVNAAIVEVNALSVGGPGGPVAAEDVSYDPTASGMAAVEVQAALDELAAATGGASVVLSITKVMTNAEIKQVGLDTTFELFPALGAGRGYMPICGHMVSHIVAPYTNQTNLVEFTIGWDNDNADATTPMRLDLGGFPWTLLEESQVVQFLAGDATPTTAETNTAVPIAFVLNKNLGLYVENPDGAFTGGDPANTLTVTMLYYEITV